MLRGAFTISLDFELIWGTRDRAGPDAFRRACEIERSEIIDQLLDLFERYEISATWCTLGHLFLGACTCAAQKHPEIVPPEHAWCGGAQWFAADPCTDEQQDPIFYGASLLDKIGACAVEQEIGCHSFSHVIFGDPGCSRETAQSELRECVRLAEERGVSLRSFAFPRNSVGHLDLLTQHGFECYRGPEPYEERAWPTWAKRAAHLLAVLTAARPPVHVPEATEAGLWNIPGSMIFFPAHGKRRHIPVGLRTRRAIKGLDRAASERRVFHLWFHPTNLTDRLEDMMLGLERVLRHAAELRGRDAIDILPMGDVVAAARS